MSIETVELSHLLISLAQSIKEGLGKEGEPHPNIPMAQYSLGMLHMVKHKNGSISLIRTLERFLGYFWDLHMVKMKIAPSR